MWKNEPPEVKQHYKDLAEEEKRLHALMYPDYRFAPQQRATPPKRRNVKRNGKTDKDRCKLLAKLLLEGTSNTELKAEVERFDQDQQQQAREAGPEPTSDDYTTVVFNANPQTHTPVPPTPQLAPSPSSSSCSETPFRSPLLPPVTPPSSANLQMSMTEPSSPLSPLQFSPQAQFNVSILPLVHGTRIV